MYDVYMNLRFFSITNLTFVSQISVGNMTLCNVPLLIGNLCTFDTSVSDISSAGSRYRAGAQPTSPSASTSHQPVKSIQKNLSFSMTSGTPLLPGLAEAGEGIVI